MRNIKNNKCLIFFVLLMIFLAKANIFVRAQNQNYYGKTTDKESSSYRDRLIDYADVYTYKIDPVTKDTLLYIRSMNEYWFGIFGNANVDMSFGGLYSKTDPGNPQNVIYNKIVDFNNKLGYGYAFGIMAEWTRPVSDLSGGVKLAIIDKKIAEIGSDEIMLTFPKKYDFHADISYLIFTPYAKYSFPQYDGFYVSGGIDVAIVYNSYAYLESNFLNSGEIYHKMPLEDVKGKTRFAASVGCGYDFFIADFFATNSRVRITPFVDFKAGTNIITNNGSNWNDVALNFGLQFKLAPDIVRIDTIIRDIEKEQRQPIYIASIKDDIGVEFDGFTTVAASPSINLSVVDFPTEVAVITPEKVEPEVTVDIPTPTTPEVPKKSNIRYNQERSFSFTGSASTTLTKAMRDELDEYVRFMKANPRSISRVQGHSDNTGSLQVNTDRSRARANAARNYMMSKGIAGNRIFVDYRGALDPVAPNDTPANRRRNNRIEINVEAR